MIIVGKDPKADKKVNCPQCGWSGYIGECKVALWLDMVNTTPVKYGGDGKNYRCPKCNLKLDQVRYPKMNVVKR